MNRPVLVGMSNPYRGEEPLSPERRHTAGGRLYQVLHDYAVYAQPDEYAKRFERVNLCARTWDYTEAVLHASELECEWQDRCVVLLGTAVRMCFRLEPRLLEPIERKSVTFFQLPHPSGLCRWYNDATNRARAGELLAYLYREDHF